MVVCVGIPTYVLMCVHRVCKLTYVFGHMTQSY